MSYDRAAIHAVLDEALVCHVGFVVDGLPVVLPHVHALASTTRPAWLDPPRDRRDGPAAASRPGRRTEAAHARRDALPGAPELLVTATTRRVEPEELLRTLLEVEIASRDASSTRHGLRTAGFPVIETLEDFDVSAQPRAQRRSTAWPRWSGSARPSTSA